jgi:hypothetical protein
MLFTICTSAKMGKNIDESIAGKWALSYITICLERPTFYDLNPKEYFQIQDLLIFLVYFSI